VTTVGLALFAYQLAGGPGAAAIVGNALTLRILAFLLFSQPAGVLADRWDKRKMLIASDLVRCALLAVFPFITTVWQVYALVFAINAVTAFFTPAYDATIPGVVGKDHYIQAVSLSRVGRRCRERGGAGPRRSAGRALWRAVGVLVRCGDVSRVSRIGARRQARPAGGAAGSTALPASVPR
jgi:NRE family putative nickel resistance protein-like MFS transporter